MFNLRDLIYSQSQPSQTSDIGFPSQISSQEPQNQEYGQVEKPRYHVIFKSEPEPPFIDHYATNQIEDIYEENVKFERKSEKRRRKPNITLQSKRADPFEAQHPIELGLPENKYAHEVTSSYLPGMTTHTLPSHTPTLYDRREMMVLIWRECYYSKDFRGALMTLKELANVYSLEYPDLYMMVDILRGAENGGLLLYQLVQSIAMNARLSRRLQASRRRAIGLFADAFVSINDIAHVKELFANRLVDPAYYDYFSFVSMNAMIICYECVMLAHRLRVFIQEHDDDNDDVDDDTSKLLSIPSISDIIFDPLEYERIVEVIMSQSASIDTFTSTSSLSHQAAAELRIIFQDSRKIISELKSAFSAVTRFSVAQEGAIDVVQYYIAFLRGTGQHDRVWPCMESHLSQLKNQYKKSLKSSQKLLIADCIQRRSCYIAYLRLVMKYISRIELSSSLSSSKGLSDNASISPSSNHDSTVNINESTSKLIDMSKKWLSIVVQSSSIPSTCYTNPPTIEAVLIAYIMNRLRKLPTEKYIHVLCNFIESSPVPSTFTQGRDDSPSSMEAYAKARYRLLGWLLLADILGAIPSTPELEDPIAQSSDIAMHLPTCVSTEHHHIDNDTHVHVADVDDDVDDQEKGTIEDILESYRWWTDTILSASNLGSYLDYVTESEHINPVIMLLDATPNQSSRSQDLNNPQELQEILISICASGMHRDACDKLVDRILWIYHIPPLASSFTIKSAAFQPSYSPYRLMKVFLLGHGFIQQVIASIIVNTHMYGPDSSYTIVGIQTLILNYNVYKSADNAVMARFVLEGLDYLRSAGLNVQRAARIGLMLGMKGISTLESYPQPSAYKNSQQDGISHMIYNPL